MAGSTPPPGTPEPPDQLGDSTAYGPLQPHPEPRGAAARRAPIIVVLAVVMALLLGGGAFAFLTLDPLHLFRPGPQAAEGLPADAIVYAGMDLDPTAAQKVDALRFLNHFPAFRSSAGLPDENADVRKTLITKLLTSAGCTDVGYASDVQPWLGQRFGFALMPPTATDEQPFAVAVQVRDEDQARDGIHALLGCGSGSTDTAGVAYSNGYLLLAQTQAEADAYAKAATEHSLADDPEFTADIDSLGELGVATMWVDVQAAVTAFAEGADGADRLGDLSGLTGSTQRAAATFRFGSDHVEIATSVFGDTPSVDHGDNPVVHLPESTVFAVSESGGDQRVGQLWDTMLAQSRKQHLDLDKQISDFEASSGLSLPDDLETILGHNIMVALDGEGLTSQALAGSDPAGIDLGVRFTNDPAKLDVIYARLMDLVDSGVDQSMPFVKKDVDDGLVIATNDAYADKLGALDGSLGDSDAFRSVVDDGANQELVLYVNLDSVKDQLIQSMQDDGASADAIANIEPLKAFGITAHVDGDYMHGTVRLSVDG